MDLRNIPATWIEPEGEIDIEKRQPACMVKKEFRLSREMLSGEKEAALFVTSHGCYEAYINGKRVGDFIFAPGTGDYQALLPVQKYEVRELLAEGENTIQVFLGDGWYRSASGVEGKRNLFGDHLGLLLWLSLDDEVVMQTDGSWLAAGSKALLSSDMCQGEYYDASGEADYEWHSVYEKAYDFSNLSFADYLPITEHERFEGKLITTPKGETVIDFGQNLAGYVEFSFIAKKGKKLTLTHGETLDEEGNFTIQNFQPGERHAEGGIFQRVTYVAKEGENTYKPHFAIFGFRYALVETELDLSEARFTAIAVYSKMKQTAEFTCSNALVNQFFANTVWSMKGNFCDVPTDCPTRERAGWTGDAGVFIHTGLYLMDCEKVFEKWLAACRINQYPNGMVRNIAPKNNKESRFSKLLAGSAGWGDAVVIVPYRIYKRFGNVKILEDNYDMMRRWLDYLHGRAKKGGLRALFHKNPYKEYEVSSGIDYGEWCEAGVEMKAGIDIGGKSGTATAYLSYSAGLLAEIAEILGRPEDAKKYKEIRDMAKKAYQCKFIPQGKTTSERQKDYVRPLIFDLAREEDRAGIAAGLDALVRKNDYHLNTGFLSTPHLCKALSEAGYVETAYRLLLQETAPGWLYQVKQGATTVWETWDGRASRNHYSYGAVCGWLIENVCGIRYEDGQIKIMPQPCKLLDYARAIYQSPVGKITVGWKVAGDGFDYEIEIPQGQRAIVKLPGKEEVIL